MRRTGTVAVPVASALVGAVAAASVAWAAVHGPTVVAGTPATTTVTQPAVQRHTVVRGDDDGVRQVVVGVTQTAPPTHTTSGASGAVH